MFSIAALSIHLIVNCVRMSRSVLYQSVAIFWVLPQILPHYKSWFFDPLKSNTFNWSNKNHKLRSDAWSHTQNLYFPETVWYRRHCKKYLFPPSFAFRNGPHISAFIVISFPSAITLPIQGLLVCLNKSSTVHFRPESLSFIFVSSWLSIMIFLSVFVAHDLIFSTMKLVTFSCTRV